MLTRRTPIKSAGFKSSAPSSEQRDPDRVRSMPTVTPGAFRAPEPVASAPAARVEKSAPVRSEALRRAVASLPCINCGVPGYSQCAHSNSGKGAGIKASDLDSFPLCTVHPGADGRLVQGCHENFDQGALFTKAVRRELEPVWAADTRRKIQAMGLWPKGLPLKNFSTGDDFELTRKNRT